MKLRSKLLTGLLAVFFALAGLACEVEDFEGEPLEEDIEEDFEEDGEDA